MLVGWQADIERDEEILHRKTFCHLMTSLFCKDSLSFDQANESSCVVVLGFH